MITLGVLFGGKSGEHEVSLLSAYNVINALDKNKYNIVLIGITREGEWSIYSGDIEKIPDGTWEYDDNNYRNFSLFTDETIRGIDIMFPVLHGTFGEDGTIQGLFEMIGKPYVGCGVLASSVAMDKISTKTILEMNGIKTSPWISALKNEIENNINDVITRIESVFKYPIFVKPSNMGSSVGISKSYNREELVTALLEASRYDNRILIEKAISGIEIEVAVLGNYELTVSYPGQIVSCNDFYDYDAKYLTGDASKIIIPAPLDNSVIENVRQIAAVAFRAIDGSGLSRIDFFIENDTNTVILNEINTLPGFTNISMYPKLMEYIGISYSDLLDRLIDLGFERYKLRKGLKFKK